MTRLTAVLGVLRRAHPRPLSPAAIVWNLDRAGGRTTIRSVMRALETLRKSGQVRRVLGSADLGPLYGLAPPACRVCGRDVGAGGTCSSCGEAA